MTEGETRSDKREMGSDRRGGGIRQKRRRDLTGEETGSDRRGDVISQERRLDLTGEET